jgi:hypothetical protein
LDKTKWAVSQDFRSLPFSLKQRNYMNINNIFQNFDSWHVLWKVIYDAGVNNDGNKRPSLLPTSAIELNIL